MFSIIRGFVGIDCWGRFTVIDCECVHTLDHNLRLYKQHCNASCRLTLLSAATLRVTLRLPAHVVNSDSAAVFKRWLAYVGHSLVLLLCPACFYRAMLCIRGTSHGPVSVSVFVCLSVTSRSSTNTAKRRITEITPHSSFFDAKDVGEIRSGSPPTGAPNAGGVGQIGDFRQK